MSAFEVKLTPNRVKARSRVESREPTDVIMAPFSAKAIVQFEDVPVTKSAKRILRITNPTNDDIEVRVTKAIPPEHNVVLSWTENVISAQSASEIEVTWSPVLEIACKETLQLTDNRNFRKDIMVILKSKSNHPPKNTRKFPTLSSGASGHVKTLRLKSPRGQAHVKKVAAQAQQQRKRQQRLEQPTAGPRWKNVPSEQPAKTQRATSTPVVSTPYAHCPLTERNVLAHQERSAVPEIESTVQAFDAACEAICKENVSPLTPGNVLSLIDQLTFTPATAGRHDPVAHGDNLAAWPTPVSSAFDSAPRQVPVRPRRISPFDLMGEETEPNNTGRAAVPLIAVTDQTFELRDEAAAAAAEPFETFAITSFDGSGVEAGRLSVGTAINKTTTVLSTPIVRALHMIQEEECNGSAADGALQKTYTKPCCVSPPPDLKRDIKLVGTPLRKYSKSMKDLSWPSQTKIAIQGSMPNLNERESIRSFEQNRYFHQNAPGMSIIHEQQSLAPSKDGGANADEPASLNSSEVSTVSQAELQFNQSEILAQSSRFNVNEAGLKSARKPPMAAKFLDAGRASRKQTPPKTDKKSSEPEQEEYSARNRPQKKRSLHDRSFSADSVLTVDTVDTAKSDGGQGKEGSGSNMSPPKRQRLDSEVSLQQLRVTPTNASAARNKSWSQTQPKKFKLIRTLSLVKKPPAERVKLYDAELYLQACINPDPFAASTTCDPFLAATMYLDERAVEKHQVDFKKWLNALVTTPAELDADCNAKIDVGKLFNEVRHKELTLAPTKEEQSMNYLTQTKLEALRRAAVQLFLSEELRLPCSKVAVYVNKNAISIRSDRNLHLDVVMQRYILELLLCFNPLWLRLGLEVVYGEKIHLHSNNDIVGLSTFILNRLFRDRFLEQKYARAYTLSEEYADRIKKFTLQKMLALLLFLDKAKTRRIVKHNPCLFVKKSPYKETKEILLRFASELLASIGDITRVLKRFGYVLQHKQNFIDEFDYAFHNLAVDLRDGIRLTRIMEIILLRDDLTPQLRAPAISRLQRVFNVNLGLRALRDAEFELRGEIAAADIVDGHREKTLSLLWQIIYKFRSPKFHAAARVLQTWWRRSLLRVIVARRIRAKAERRRQVAATRIQALFRGYLARKYCRAFAEERTRAALVLQKHVRGRQARVHFHRSLGAIATIQHWYRAHHLGRHHRRYFVELRSCTVFVQRLYRRRLLAKKLLQLGALAATMREVQRSEAATLCIQTRWRALKRMRLERAQFQRQRQAASFLQCHFRARRQLQQHRCAFVALRTAAINVQRRFRAQMAMRQDLRDYEDLRAKVVFVQRKWRATRSARRERLQFLALQYHALLLQQKFRATRQMRLDRASFEQLRSATVAMQRRWRATRLMRVGRAAFVGLRSAAVRVQQKFRANRRRRQEQASYKELRGAAILLQRRFRANRSMRTAQQHFQDLRTAAIGVQRSFRANRAMRLQQVSYKQLRLAVVQLQQKFRATKRMRSERSYFQELRLSAIRVQRRFRANRSMRVERFSFQRLRLTAIAVQRRFRANRLRRREQAQYQRLRSAVVLVQQTFRANRSRSRQQTSYRELRGAAVVLQRRFRANKLKGQAQSNYRLLRSAAIRVQCRFRANRRMRVEHGYFRQLRSSAVVVQQRFRANRCRRREQTSYEALRAAVVVVQRRFRANKAMGVERDRYQRQRSAAIVVQRRFRAQRLMCLARSYYLQLRGSVVKVQQRFRANRLQCRAQASFQRQRLAAVTLQRWWRALRQMRLDHAHYQRLQWAAGVLQRRYRARRLMLRLRAEYLLLRSLIVCMQRKYRARIAMLRQRREFVLLKSSAVLVQQRFRAKGSMREQQVCFQQLRRCAVQLQAYGRGWLSRRHFQALMTPEMVEMRRRKKAAALIQRFWRGYRIRKRVRSAALQNIRSNIAARRGKVPAAHSIRFRMQDAVRILRGRYSSSEALQVLIRLDCISRTVPHLLMCHADFIATFCYDIMAQTIRSEVDKQLIRYCSRIILNLARFNSTTVNTFQEGGLTTVAQMLLRWCDKDNEIFNTLCTLIWIFAHCARKRRIIRDFMTTPEAIYVVRETKKLVARKEKMLQNVRKPSVAITPRHGRSSQLHSFSSRALPALRPDYGVTNNQPYTFISSSYAFDTILFTLGIDIF